MNIFYLKVELITLCSVLTYFYVVLKSFDSSGNYISKHLSFLAYSWILMFLSILYKLSISKFYGKDLLVLFITIIISTVSLYIIYKMYNIYKTSSKSKEYILTIISVFLLSLFMFFEHKDEYQIVIRINYVMLCTNFIGVLYLAIVKKMKKNEFGIIYLSMATSMSFLSILILRSSGLSNSIFILTVLVLKILLTGIILIFFYDSQKIFLEQLDNLSSQSKKLTEAEIKILKLAYIDQVTQIPNNIAFQKDYNDKYYLNNMRIVLLINLDNFKYINNLIGFTKGNDYLKKVANLICDTLGKGDKVYSLSGDQFAIIHYGDEISAGIIASNIINELNNSRELSVKHYKMGASIGISNISLEHDYNKTMREVEIALLEVKNSGKNNYLYYDSKLDKLYENKLMIENKLDQALVKNQFQMYFQPQVDLVTCKVVGLEALIRWIDDDGNFISPEEFIPLAEKTGKMNKISVFIMHESLKRLSEVHELGYFDIKMSINVSPIEIFEERFVIEFMKKVKAHNVNPKMINLEITETSLIENIEQASIIFRELRENNISISLDDFGVGYSSLNYFSKLPISEVKFDKTFTNDLLYSKKNEIILKHFTELSHTLGIDVVIEGIENNDQLSIVQRLGCDKYQGYLYSKPLPFDKIVELLEKNKNVVQYENIEIS